MFTDSLNKDDRENWDRTIAPALEDLCKCSVILSEKMHKAKRDAQRCNDFRNDDELDAFENDDVVDVRDMFDPVHAGTSSSSSSLSDLYG